MKTGNVLPERSAIVFLAKIVLTCAQKSESLDLHAVGRIRKPRPLPSQEELALTFPGIEDLGRDQ
jgi:hypothetical protein